MVACTYKENTCSRRTGLCKERWESGKERGETWANKQPEFDLSIRTLENRAVVRPIKWRTEEFLLSGGERSGNRGKLCYSPDVSRLVAILERSIL